MILQRPIESAYTDAPELLRVATEEETTADLPFENTVDLTPTAENEALDAADFAALNAAAPQEVATTRTVDSDSNPVHDARTADAPTMDDGSLSPTPEGRTLGFFAFAACALIGTLVMTQRPTESSSPSTEFASAAKGPANETQLTRTAAGAISADSQKTPKPADTPATQSVEPTRKSAAADASVGVVAFQSRAFVTSEQAMAAVFILKRTQAVRGRALVHWAAHSGSADAGIDFSDASGTVRFADGQRQLAIYVPLRNDLLKEEDETFKVCLRSPRQARIGGRSCAEVTILDDDGIAPT